MNGDKALIAMRTVGTTPAGVWVTDSDDVYSRTTAREWPQHNEPVTGHRAAHLRIEAGDIPEALDLRCVVGLTCHIASDRSATRFTRIFDALVAAGARIVVGLHDGKGRLHVQKKETVHG